MSHCHTELSLIYSIQILSTLAYIPFWPGIIPGSIESDKTNDIECRLIVHDCSLVTNMTTKVECVCAFETMCVTFQNVIDKLH